MITDPQVLAEVQAYRRSQSGQPDEAPQGASFVEEPTEEKSILQDIGQGAQSGWEGLKMKGNAIAQSIAELAGDEEGSRYSNRKMRIAGEQKSRYDKDLGIAGEIASMAVQSAPEVASMFVPGGLAAKAVTQFGVGGISEFGDIMSQGFMENKKVDKGNAALAAAGAGAIDATIGRFMPTGSKLPTRIASAVTQDAASGGQHQVLQNLALGKDWNENIAEAAAGSVVAGGVLRGGMSGFNKAMGFNFNKGGEDASLKVGTVNKGTNRDVDQAFMNDYIEYKNGSEGLLEMAAKTSDSNQRNEIINAKIANDVKYSEGASVMEAASLLKDAGAPMTPVMFNYVDSNGNSVGKKLGYSEDEMLTFEKRLNEATPGSGDSNKYQLRVETAESVAKKTKEVGDKIIGDALGSYANNINTAKELLRKADLEGIGGAERDRLVSLINDLKDLSTMSTEWSSNKNVANSDSYRVVASRAMKEAVELGIYDQLRGIGNKPGSFNPINDYDTLKTVDKMVSTQNLSFHRGTPDVASEKSKKFTVASDFATGAIGLSAGGPIGAVAALGAKKTASALTNKIKGSLRRRTVRKGKEETGNLIDQIRNSAELARKPRQFTPTTQPPGGAVDTTSPIMADTPTTPVEAPVAASDATISSDLSAGNLEGAANAAETTLASKGVPVSPTPQPSVMDTPTPFQRQTGAVGTSQPASRTPQQELQETQAAIADVAAETNDPEVVKALASLQSRLQQRASRAPEEIDPVSDAQEAVQIADIAEEASAKAGLDSPAIAALNSKLRQNADAAMQRQAAAKAEEVSALQAQEADAAAARDAEQAAKRAEAQSVLSTLRKRPEYTKQEAQAPAEAPAPEPTGTVVDTSEVPMPSATPRVTAQDLSNSAKVVNQRRRAEAAKKKAEAIEEALEKETEMAEVLSRHETNAADLSKSEKIVERLRANAEKAREKADAEALKAAEVERLEAERIEKDKKAEEDQKAADALKARSEARKTQAEEMVKKPAPKKEEVKAEEPKPEPEPTPAPEPEVVKPRKKIDATKPKPREEPVKAEEPKPEPTPDDLNDAKSIEEVFQRSPDKIPLGIQKHLKEKLAQKEKAPTFEGVGIMSRAGKDAVDRAKMVRTISQQEGVGAHKVDAVITELGIKNYDNSDNARKVKDFLKKEKAENREAGKAVVQDLISKERARNKAREEKLQSRVKDLQEKNKEIREKSKSAKNRALTPAEKKEAIEISKAATRSFANSQGATEADILDGYASLGLTEGVDLSDPISVNKAIMSAKSNRIKEEAKAARDAAVKASKADAQENGAKIKAAKESAIRAETELNNAKNALAKAERSKAGNDTINSLKKQVSKMEEAVSRQNELAGNLEAERKRSAEALAQTRKELSESVSEAQKAAEGVKNLERLESQISELREDLSSRGVPEGYIDDEIFKSLGRATEPMSESSYRALRARAIDKADAEAIKLLKARETDSLEDLETTAAQKLIDLDAQKESIKEVMVKDGSTPAFAEAFVDRRFAFLDEPVSTKELNAISRQASSATAKDYQDFIAAREKMLKERDAEIAAETSSGEDLGEQLADKVSNMSPEEADGVLDALLNNFGDLISGKSKEMSRLASALSSLSSFKESKALDLESKDARVMKALGSVLSETAKMKNKHPNQPWLWLTREQVDSLGDAYRSNDRFGKDMGSLGPKLRLAVFGSTVDQPLLSRDAREEIVKTGVSYEKFLKPYDWFSKNPGQANKDKKGDFYYRSRVRPDGTMTYIKIRKTKQ